MNDLASADEVYATLGVFAKELGASGGFGPMLRDVGYVLQIELTDPSASIALIPNDEGMDVGVRVTDPVATVRMNLPAMIMHRILLGYDSFSAAVDRKELTVSEGADAFVPLIARLSFAAFPRYEDQLLDMGRSDLL